MKKIVLLCVGLFVLVLLYLFLRPVSYKNLPPTATGEWIAYGDSLTAGYGSSEGNSYPALLSQRLGIPIRNMGVSGDSTVDGLKRLDEALNLQPRVVFLCLGGNDGLQRLSSDEMISNLRQMIAAFHQKGAFVVLIGVRSVSILDSNDSRFKKLAKEEQVLYVPNILNGILGSSSLMSDQIHPNDAGYQVIAERLYKIIEPLLPQLKQG